VPHAGAVLDAAALLPVALQVAVEVLPPLAVVSLVASVSTSTAAAARLAAPVSQPVAAVSRLAALVSRPVAAVSRLAAPVSRPVAAVLRLAALVSQPVAAELFAVAALPVESLLVMAALPRVALPLPADSLAVFAGCWRCDRRAHEYLRYCD
jgi:hypothetical protein